MNIFNFNNIAFTSIVLWIIAMLFILFDKKIKKAILIGNILTIIGTLLIIVFLSIMWIEIERPPFRTLGETRIWYAVFLPIVGILTFNNWKYKWFLFYSLFLAILFLIINILNPENFDKTLMPALQSPWFVPHVIVYMVSYAFLGVSSLVSAWGIYLLKFKTFKTELLDKADNLVYIGFSFLTLGLLFGALWAKEAWGHYWTWDPKETWALLTWFAYLLYIHFRYRHKKKIVIALWILALAFIILLICWVGINYLAVASNSVHTYGS